MQLRPSLSVCAVGLCLLTTSELVAQTGFTVRGTVTERESGRGVVATISLEDAGRTLSNASGEFAIRGVRPGRYAVTVEALGYRTARTVILVVADVSGTILLDREPIPLDPLDVQPAKVSLRGRVVEKGNGRSVPYLTVDLGIAGQTTTNDAGGFRVGGILRGRHSVRVEGFGWLPLSVDLLVESDTSIRLEVERDQITERIIAQQVAKLSERVSSTGAKLVVLGRETFLESRAPTPVEVLASRGGVQVRSCPETGQPLCVYSRNSVTRPAVYIDDRLIGDGLEILGLYPNAMIERIEVMANGRHIRMYTTWFIQRLSEGLVRLMPIIR